VQGHRGGSSVRVTRFRTRSPGPVSASVSPYEPIRVQLPTTTVNRLLSPLGTLPGPPYEPVRRQADGPLRDPVRRGADLCGAEGISAAVQDLMTRSRTPAQNPHRWGVAPVLEAGRSGAQGVGLPTPLLSPIECKARGQIPQTDRCARIVSDGSCGCTARCSMVGRRIREIGVVGYSSGPDPASWELTTRRKHAPMPTVRISESPQSSPDGSDPSALTYQVLRGHHSRI
jgi:hypothetical protein